MKAQPRIGILFYTTQPFVALGLAAALKVSGRVHLLGSSASAPELVQQLRAARPDVLLIQIASGPSLAELARLHAQQPDCPIVLWGDDPGGDFAFQAMQLGVRALLPNDTPVANLLTTILNVHGGVLCFGKGFVEKVMSQQRITLTNREGQLAWLVAQGFKNKAIGATLGITEGTVKVYIYKLFKKLGVDDRLQMALYVRENLGGNANGPPIVLRPRAVPHRADDLFTPHSLPALSPQEVHPHRIN